MGRSIHRCHSSQNILRLLRLPTKRSKLISSIIRLLLPSPLAVVHQFWNSNRFLGRQMESAGFITEFMMRLASPVSLRSWSARVITKRWRIKSYRMDHTLIGTLLCNGYGHPLRITDSRNRDISLSEYSTVMRQALNE